MRKVFAITFLVAVLVFVLYGGRSKESSTKFDTAQDIMVITRLDGSGTKTTIMAALGLTGKPDPVNAIVGVTTASTLEIVRNNPAAIAFNSLGHVVDDVKKLKVDGVEATVENIRNGTYPFSRPLSVIYKESSLDDPVNAAFFAFLKSSFPKNVFSSGGFICLRESASDYTGGDALLSGTIVMSGATALQYPMIDIAAEFGKLYPNITVEISGGDSVAGYIDAEEGRSTFGLLAEKFNPDLAPSCAVLTLCMDGVAIIVHKDNPLDNITMEQLRNIYADDAGANAITRWNQLIR
jgi:phosphate transport system substrate-binding protein